MKKRSALIIGGFLFLLPPQAGATPFILQFQTGNNAVVEISADMLSGRIWIDVLPLLRYLEVQPYAKKGVYVMEFPTHTLAINPKKATYSILKNGEKKWKNAHFEKRSFKNQNRLMVPLEELPQLVFKSFTYHRQKRVLSIDQEELNIPQKSMRHLHVRHVVQDRRVWIALEDLAQALAVVVFSSQAKRYSLVLPDFSILELRIGETNVYKRNIQYIRLSDPPLLFSGSPYISIRTINPLFGIDATWNANEKELVIPSQYGRMRELVITKPYRMRYVGYQPVPLKFKFDEFMTYYQNLEPSYSSSHQAVYESVRDFLTNEPIDQNSRGLDRWSAEAVANLQGSVFQIPLEGKGAFEKVGSTSRLINGTMKYGFPLLEIKGGREYITMNGLNNQFHLVDQVSVSHSNDRFGDRDINPLVQEKITFGENEFSVFLATSQFSQTVEYKQRFGMASADASWNISGRQYMGLKFEHYLFSNKINEVAARKNQAPFLEGIFGESDISAVDPADQLALANTVLTDRHMTTIVNLNYGIDKFLDLTGVLGNSAHKDKTQDGKRVMQQDWMVRAVLERKRSRLDVSFERIDPNYKAFANPLVYQDRKIFRIAPFLDFTRIWKLFGEVRREDSSVLVRQDLPSYTNHYRSMVNLFNFQTNVIRLSATDYDSTLYGRNTMGESGFTHYFGRDSLDMGATASSQSTSDGTLFKRSATGKLGYQVLRPAWKFSVGHEYTRDNYPAYHIRRHQSSSNLIAQVGEMRAFAQYEVKPKYFLLEDKLHTGILRLGHEAGKGKVVDLFLAVSSLRSNLSHPEVWRAGVQYVYDFY